MTRQEAIKILSILKAAYPNSYKGMTKEDANGTVAVWATQFNNMPYMVVTIAVNKLISTNVFPPSISEVKSKIRDLYWEAIGALPYSEGGLYASNDDYMPAEKIALLKDIIAVVEPMRTQQILEPSLNDLIGGYNDYLTEGNKQLDGGD